MSDLSALKVGDKVVLRSRLSRFGKVITTITKRGRKYFQVAASPKNHFDIDTGKEALASDWYWLTTIEQDAANETRNRYFQILDKHHIRIENIEKWSTDALGRLANYVLLLKQEEGAGVPEPRA